MVIKGETRVREVSEEAFRRDLDRRQADLALRVRLGTEVVPLGDVEEEELRGLTERQGSLWEALSLSSFLEDPEWLWGDLSLCPGTSVAWPCNLRPVQAPPGSSVSTSIKSAWGLWPPPSPLPRIGKHVWKEEAGRHEVGGHLTSFSTLCRAGLELGLGPCPSETLHPFELPALS